MKKRCHGRLSSLIWGLFLIFLSYQLMLGEEKSVQDDPLEKEKKSSQVPVVEIHLTPLEIHSFLDPDLARVIQDKSHVRDNLNLAIKVFDPEFFLHLHRQRVIKSHGLENSLFTTSLATMAGLNFADYFTTLKALKYEGLQEANPLIKPLTKNAALFAAVKIGLTVYNFHAMKNLYQKNKKLAWTISLISNAVMAYIVVHNLNMIKQAEAK